MNPYETLKLSPTATDAEIKEAYRKQAKRLHPDLNPGNKRAEEKFKEINAAYELIGTPEARAKFDRGEREPSEPSGRGPGGFGGGGGGGGSPFGGMNDDIFSSIFEGMHRGGAGGRRSRRPVDEPGEDVHYRMDVEFRDAILGAEREITLTNGKRLRVKIPAGVNSGGKLRFAGQGSNAPGSGPAGDAYVEIHVLPSRQFRRIGNDLEMDLPISLAEAILGAEVKVPTIEGSVLMKIPAGVSAGGRLRIAGKGVGQPGGKRGDQFANLKLILPPEIDAEFKAAVEAWKERQPFDPRMSSPFADFNR